MRGVAGRHDLTASQEMRTHVRSFSLTRCVVMAGVIARMQATETARRPARLPAKYALFGAVAAVLALGAVQQAQGGVERPSDEDEVLAHVPARDDGEVRALEQLRLRAELAPRDLHKALALARSYIEASRRAGDPRYLGAAEAALASFCAGPDPVPEVRLLRATILQSRHEFDAALRDLDRVVEVTPDDAQAWLTRATVLTVQGKYEQARASCSALAPLVTATHAIACVAPIDGLTGRGDHAREQLERAVQASRSSTDLAWLHSLAGEQAFWLGDPAASERHLRAALQLDGDDRYTRALYADLLLDGQRYAEARALLSGHSEDDALALRSALADLAQGQRDSMEGRKVAQNFEASRLRGDAVHRREEARMWLARGDAPRALGCALESWAVQREPWDARLVLEAAVAAGQPERAAPVLAWLHTTHFEAPRLRALARSLETRP
ncbi:MAG: hypothetical protein JWN04_6124 [Myxococcaceae bacterium]|nr:hypothetical protein [Myxococcaceae bacterium]